MIIEETGKYRLTADFSSRGSMSISHLPKGYVFSITQIDRDGRKIIGPDFLDWEGNDIPCEKVVEIDTRPDRGMGDK